MKTIYHRLFELLLLTSPLPLFAGNNDGISKAPLTRRFKHGSSSDKCSAKWHHGRVKVDAENSLLYVCTSSGWQEVNLGSTFRRDYLAIAEEKSAGEDGGVPMAGVWNVRNLNVIKADSGGNATIIGNVIRLKAGTYECTISAPVAANSGSHQARLYNNTTDEVILYGTSEISGNVSNFTTALINMTTRSVITGRFNLTEDSDLVVQHRVQQSFSQGFGRPVRFDSVEIYTFMECYRVE